MNPEILEANKAPKKASAFLLLADKFFRMPDIDPTILSDLIPAISNLIYDGESEADSKETEKLYSLISLVLENWNILRKIAPVRRLSFLRTIIMYSKFSIDDALLLKVENLASIEQDNKYESLDRDQLLQANNARAALFISLAWIRSKRNNLAEADGHILSASKFKFKKNDVFGHSLQILQKDPDFEKVKEKLFGKAEKKKPKIVQQKVIKQAALTETDLQGQIKTLVEQIVHELTQLSKEDEIYDNLKLKPGKPATDKQIDGYEKFIGHQLPPSYRVFLKLYNGYKSLNIYGNLFSIQDVMENRTIRKEIKNWRTEQEGWTENKKEAERIKKAILIGEENEFTDWIFLDPLSVPANGEMKTIEWSHEDDPDTNKDFPSYLKELLKTAKWLRKEAKSNQL